MFRCAWHLCRSYRRRGHRMFAIGGQTVFSIVVHLISSRERFAQRTPIFACAGLLPRALILGQCPLRRSLFRGFQAQCFTLESENS